MHFYQQMNWQTTDIISSTSNSPLLVHNHSNDVTLLQLASLYTISVIQSAATHYNSQLSAAVGVPQPTQSTSFQRRSSQPITWLILTNKTVQENTQTKYNPKNKQNKVQQKQNYPGSVASYNTRPGNELEHLLHSAPRPTRSKWDDTDVLWYNISYLLTRWSPFNLLTICLVLSVSSFRLCTMSKQL